MAITAPMSTPSFLSPSFCTKSRSPRRRPANFADPEPHKEALERQTKQKKGCDIPRGALTASTLFTSTSPTLKLGSQQVIPTLREEVHLLACRSLSSDCSSAMAEVAQPEIFPTRLQEGVHDVRPKTDRLVPAGNARQIKVALVLYRQTTAHESAFNRGLSRLSGQAHFSSLQQNSVELNPILGCMFALKQVLCASIQVEVRIEVWINLRKSCSPLACSSY